MICTGLEIAAGVGVVGGLLSQNSASKRAEKDREKAAKRPIIDPEAERQRVRERAARARQRAKGGFGTSDTLKSNALGGSSKAPNTLLGGSS